MRIMGIFYCFIIFCLGLTSAFAQLGGVKGNEWINPTQKYIRIEVAQDGIYRIPASQFNLPADVHPDRLHLYYLGQEQILFIHNEGDPNRLDGNDYLEFFGERMDGRTETPLYRHPTRHYNAPNIQANPFANTMSDTSAYFLTWNDSVRSPQFNYQPITSSPEALAQITVEQPFYRHIERVIAPIRYYSQGGSISKFDTYREGSCSYTTGEGYVFTPGKSFRVNLKAPFPFLEAQSPPLLSAYVHAFNPAASQSANLMFGEKQVQVFIGADTMTTLRVPLSTADLKSVNTFGLDAQLDNYQLAVAYVQLDYDRHFQFNQDTKVRIQWNETATETYKVSLTGLQPDTDYYLYDLDYALRIKGVWVDNKVLFAIDPKATQRRFYLLAESQIQADQANARVFIDSDIKNYTHIAGAEMIVIANPSVMQSAGAYEQYRDTCSVNRLKTIVVSTEELYDQFSYGSPNVMAFKRFIRTALDTWTIKPKYVFLWGKGYYARLGNERKTTTWGTPASDNRFVCEFNEDDDLDYVPEIPIGRLNCLTNEEGFAYLEKLKEYEYTPYQSWMKNALHLGGGDGEGEQRGIIQNLTTVQQIFESAPLGGKVAYFQKGALGKPYQPKNTTTREVLNNGVGIFCFYGHSSSRQFDVEVLHPSEYQNEGKYPFVIANGCYAGAFHDQQTLGEQFLVYPKKGAIGWLSSSSYGYMSQLSRYNQLFYQIAFRDSLGSPIGNIVRETVRRFLSVPNLSQNDYVHASQVNLQGDPSIRLYHPKGPDLELLRSDVKVTPSLTTVETKELRFQVRLRNIGSAFADSFKVGVKHEQLNGISENIDLPKQAPVLRQDTLIFTVTLPQPPTGGTHRFELFLDADNFIAEQNENNNRFTVEVIVPSDLPEILYPYPYQITNRQAITLSASAPGKANPNNTPIRYFFEADTTHLFNSPFKVNSSAVIASPDLGQWELPFKAVHNVAYYWRVRVEDSDQWATASFKYMIGRTGWGQSHFGQWQNNFTESYSYDSLTNRREFDSFFTQVMARAGSARNLEFNLDGGVNGYTNILAQEELGKTVLYSIIDGKTLRPRTNHPRYNNLDFVKVEEIQKLEPIINGLAKGDHIVLLGYYPLVSQWKWDNKVKAINAIGATDSILKIGDYDGFILVGTKGAPVGSAVLATKKRIEFTDSGAYVNTRLYSRLPAGRMESAWFGPAKNQWRSAEWVYRTEPSDRVTIQVWGQNADGNNMLLKQTTEKFIDLTDISVKAYPRLQLRAVLSDSVNRTAPQPDYWNVFYEEVPEGIHLPRPKAVMPVMVHYVGDTIRFNGKFQNLTPIRMDSLMVRAVLEDYSGNIIHRRDFRIASVAESGNVSVPYQLPTAGFKGGFHRLLVTVNPDHRQPEKTIDNNTAIVLLNFIPDTRPPVLQVSVEKKIPVNGMIISPNPAIRIQLTDDNQFQFPDDTTSVAVRFGPYDDEQLIRPYYYRTGDLIWEQMPNGIVVDFQPKNLPDGRYTLVVQGWDKVGNVAGAQPYKIEMEVRNSTSVSEIIALPNPFNEHTYFSYVLTGKTLPTEFAIDIFDVSGRKVRVLDLEATQDVGFGEVITRSSWDGTDTFGRILSEGIYIYRARIKFGNGNYLERAGKVILVR